MTISELLDAVLMFGGAIACLIGYVILMKQHFGGK